MADPRSVVPYHDPYDASFIDDILYYMNNSTPTVDDLLLLEDPSLLPSSSNPGNIQDADDPFGDPILWSITDNINGGSSQAGPSEYRAETSNQGCPENVNGGNMRTIPMWPVPAVPYLCSCCLVLREIIHTNGYETTKLEIHGRLGMICHAILEIHQSLAVYRYQMIDFCKKSMEDVKNYLVQYCDERKQAGFIMSRDPLSVFYEALCVGLDMDENLTTDDFPQPPPSNSVANEMDQPEAENDAEKPPRTSLALQRERTGKLTLEDLRNYFHLPIEEAARRLRLCPTVVKKICRRYGLHRWPYRKIKSLERQIQTATPRLNSNDPEERANAKAEIERLRREIDTASAGN
ncbi:hypothetical protein Pint_13716 [Pistacia integerrima]|uniref:Uncharacterized protein n=1 Tax=Pistacia integerrima TaxID=434235 RepID=A0ACC0Y9Y4_9ROSI|nr:hypothetical protein Pint_13716 [Pistacia integerrima]